MSTLNQFLILHPMERRGSGLRKIISGYTLKEMKSNHETLHAIDK
jgi:hypothetical protein